ncbi:hypothetical protein BATDEDRAFT_36815 [Batrachochytrium dendrobatidis JAM81]|uniref:GP-PDE domain-containing protein n=2 Tax=Batrachochytrium dendrobatidis TaxID=109871 RepID=F4P010_BATDJ|nr:uncharacterized protein BATDEDRAFT_36815 [Batrachochytrium dendrobatidis JAM81]EGF81181.1 hypothetical protein BATDEDRAFT_36815 [Batrachochytrium dendrobatidis JAM81]|eukprot:XP_006678057.1 hypothetical protein BATDEDRAFT_36815 [Batrachochytrium dendrobatidis JAM81]
MLSPTTATYKRSSHNKSAVYPVEERKMPYGSVSRPFLGLPFRHRLMSHRGGSLEHVENTMPAFRYSAKIQADMMELDVQYTKDHQVVIFHDLYLDRLCGSEFKGKKISDYNLKDLPPLLIPNKLAHLPQVVQDPESRRIPLLQDLLTEFPTYPMQIDVKDSPKELVFKVAHLLQSHNRIDKTVWGSFLYEQSKYCATATPFSSQIPRFFCAWRFLQTYFMYHVGLLGWMSIPERALIMPNYYMLMSKGYMKAIQARGVSVIMFGTKDGALNTELEWEQARDVGVNGICSDSPTKLIEWLESNPLRSMLQA